MFPQAQLKQGSALRPMMGNGARHPLDPGSLRPRGLAGARATRGASGAFRDSKGSPGFPDPPGTCSEGMMKPNHVFTAMGTQCWRSPWLRRYRAQQWRTLVA